MCPRCGNLRAECSDDSIEWHPRTSVCWASATTDWAKGVLRERYKDAKPADGALHPLDGRWVWVSTEAPPLGEDEFA